MEIKDSLREALKPAMKNRDKLRLETIRSVLSALQYEEMRLSVDDLPSQTQIAVMQSEIKKRRESIDLLTQGGRTETVPTLQEEIRILEEFLPSQLGEAELEAVVRKLAAEKPGLQLGEIMKFLKEHHSGTYDGKVASEVAKRVLNG